MGSGRGGADLGRSPESRAAGASWSGDGVAPVLALSLRRVRLVWGTPREGSRRSRHWAPRSRLGSLLLIPTPEPRTNEHISKGKAARRNAEMNPTLRYCCADDGVRMTVGPRARRGNDTWEGLVSGGLACHLLHLPCAWHHGDRWVQQAWHSGVDLSVGESPRVVLDPTASGVRGAHHPTAGPATRLRCMTDGARKVLPRLLRRWAQASELGVVPDEENPRRHVRLVKIRCAYVRTRNDAACRPTGQWACSSCGCGGSRPVDGCTVEGDGPSPRVKGY